MKGLRFVSAAACGLALLGLCRPASAYCLTRGCNDTVQDCTYDSNGCLVEGSGPLLHWASSCVSFDVQKDGSARRDIEYDEAHGAIEDAFQEWLRADCGGGQSPSIEVMDFGPVECRRAEYNQDAGNANIVMFRDDSWPYENAIDTLALTTLIFNADTGEIYDADIEVNTYESPMSIGTVGTHDIDFSSVITHEVGHFLGLSHSDAFGSTMNPSYAPGNTGMASIEDDDVKGICAALPPERTPERTSCEPRHGFSSECSVPDSGCQLVAGGRRGPASLALMLGLSSTLFARLRRAARRRAKGPNPRLDQDSAS